MSNYGMIRFLADSSGMGMVNVNVQIYLGEIVVEDE